MQLNITLRPAREEDQPFLERLRNQVDRERLHLDYWPPELDEVKKQILDFQFQAHQADRRELDWDHKHVIIENEELPIGRVIILQNSQEIRISDLEIASTHRGLGIGQSIISRVQQESIESKRPIRIHVQKDAEISQFFLAMGFRLLEDKLMCYYMEWYPEELKSKSLISTPPSQH